MKNCFKDWSQSIKPSKRYKIFGFGPRKPVFGVYNQVRLKPASILNFCIYQMKYNPQEIK